MNYEVLSIPPFDKQLKKLAKKYPSLKKDFSDLLQLLGVDPMKGTSIGKNCYKIRLAIKSKGKGKSGGDRVITNFVVSDGIVYLLSIFDKADVENLTDKELKNLLKNVPI